MKSSIEITESISNTLKKANCGLSEDQKACLNGCMAIWVDHIKEHQDKITRHACAENVSKFTDEEIVESTVIFSGEAKVCQNFRDKAHQAIMNTKAI